MPIKPRLIPVLIAATVVMFVGRIGLLWQDAGRALAQSPAASAPATAAEPAADKPAADKAPADKPSVDKPSAEKPKEAPVHYTAAEVQLLQELSKRRSELDARAEELDRREMLAHAAEQRIDEKIGKLQAYQQQIEALIGKVHEEDDARLTSLVHIYETMKPKEAAAIFEGMEMPSLIELMTRMTDQKAAPIFAAMSPDKARLVTAALEQRRAVPDMKVN